MKRKSPARIQFDQSPGPASATSGMLTLVLGIWRPHLFRVGELRMKVSLAYPPYGNAFKYAGAVEGLSIDKGLRFRPTIRGDDPQAADVLAGVVALQRPRKENDWILLFQI